MIISIHHNHRLKRYKKTLQHEHWEVGYGFLKTVIRWEIVLLQRYMHSNRVVSVCVIVVLICKSHILRMLFVNESPVGCEVSVFTFECLTAPHRNDIVWLFNGIIITG